MSNRCPDCNKFASLETGEPEVQNLEVNEDGLVSCSVRIVRTCADCSGEMKETTLDAEAQVEDLCKCKEHDLTVEEGDLDTVEEGGGRYAKSYYGFTLTAKVACDKSKKTFDVELTEKAAASEFEDMN